MNEDPPMSDAEGNGSVLPPAPPVAELLALAVAPYPAAPSWTRAGRASQKHGYRPTGSVYDRVTGPAAHYHAVGRRIGEEVLSDPRSAVVVRSRRRYGKSMPLLDVVSSDGRRLGYRWEPALAGYVFEGLREPQTAPTRQGQ